MGRECRERFPRHRLQRKLLVSDPGMHHDTCVTHVLWCISGSLTRGGGENVPGIPGARATKNLTYLVRGPWCNATAIPQRCTFVLQTELGFVFSTKGKTPFMVYDGQEIADTHFCIQHLNRARGIDLNSWLTDEQRAVARAFQMMTEDHTFWWVWTTLHQTYTVKSPIKVAPNPRT